MSNLTFMTEQTLATITCASCGCLFAIPKQMQDSLWNAGDSFYCPSGHSNIYKSRIRELEARLSQAMNDVSAANRSAAQERAAREQAQADMARQAKRVANGVCQCCNRSFTNLRRHMETKHPQHK